MESAYAAVAVKIGAIPRVSRATSAHRRGLMTLLARGSGEFLGVKLAGERANITRRREIGKATRRCGMPPFKRRVKQPRSSKLLVELFGLRGAGQSESVAVWVEGRGHKVKVARTYFPLVLDSGVAAFRG